MTIPISKRAQSIKPFIAMDIIERAQALQREGHDVISFSLGEPDFNPPECVVKACEKALRDGETKYTHSQGLIELREEICRYYDRNYGVSHLDPEQIIITQGSSPAFFLIFSTLLEEGDEVILPNPHYPCDANFIEFVGGQPVYLPIYQKENYQWNIQSLNNLITDKTKAIFVTSPSNPTGTVLTEEVMKGIADTNIPIVSDELYGELVYDGKMTSALQVDPNAIVVNGFSKSFAMTGFRVGYLIAPKELIRSLQKVQQNFHISANTFVQHAAITALKEADQDIEFMKSEYIKRRKVMMNGLRELGFKIDYTPEGAFYIFVDASHINSNSHELAFDILNKVHLAITPGIDFGKNAEGYLRFSYATSIERIEEGLLRLKTYLNLTL